MMHPPSPSMRVYDFEGVSQSGRSPSRRSDQTFDSSVAAAGLREAWKRTASQSISTVGQGTPPRKQLSALEEINEMDDDVLERRKTKLRSVVNDFQRMLRQCGVPRRSENLVLTPKKIADTLTTQRMRGMEQWIARAVTELICTETTTKITYFECLEALSHKSMLLRHLFSNSLLQICRNLPLDTQPVRNSVIDMLQRWELCSTFPNDMVKLATQQYNQRCIHTPIQVNVPLQNTEPNSLKKVIPQPKSLPAPVKKKSIVLLPPSSRPERSLNTREQLVGKRELRRHRKSSEMDRANYKRKASFEAEKELQDIKRAQKEEQLQKELHRQNTPKQLAKYDDDVDGEDFEVLIEDSMDLILGQDHKEKSQIAQTILSRSSTLPSTSSNNTLELTESLEEETPLLCRSIIDEGSDDEDKVIMHGSTLAHEEPPSPSTPLATPKTPTTTFDIINVDQVSPKVPTPSESDFLERSNSFIGGSQSSLLEKLLPADSQKGDSSQYQDSLLPDCSDVDTRSHITSIGNNTAGTGDLTGGAFLGATDRSRTMPVKNVKMYHAVEQKIERQRKSIVELTKQTYNHRRFEEGDYLGAVYGATSRTEVDLTAKKDEGGNPASKPSK
eukprot:TRINITY_DN2114_c1_g1_i2.p1 TRINITY_DN2114_c1_g1~~TRINITY_DN2114_c1_g1_i2.p1  ORF type:complete len:614 (+),score=117.63 TRINITY_DN2114_c1_g1_i2:61-1902(+)